ncbi:MAG: hypothetical protein AAFX50_25910 [Acidobacteriota bacterium]
MPVYPPGGTGTERVTLRHLDAYGVEGDYPSLGCCVIGGFEFLPLLEAQLDRRPRLRESETRRIATFVGLLYEALTRRGFAEITFRKRPGALELRARIGETEASREVPYAEILQAVDLELAAAVRADNVARDLAES